MAEDERPVEADEPAKDADGAGDDPEEVEVAGSDDGATMAAAAEPAAEEAKPGRASHRAPHPLWRLAKAMLLLALMAGATWALYEGLVYVAGPAVAVQGGPDRLDRYSAEAFDPQGLANLHITGVRPLPESEGEGLLITWTAHNLGTKTWFPSTHHWEPLYDGLPPLSLPRAIVPGEAAQMVVRLQGEVGPVVGWRLMGLKGPVEQGHFEVSISATGERK